MIGETLGHYEIVELLGAGGMGEVYRARDPRLQRDVALKIIPPRFFGDDDHRARFEREARLLASLNHPHIAAIHGLETDRERLFLVMEFVDGADLARRLAGGPLPLDEVLAVAGQVADALDAAHRQGVVHRDLKPANVALTSAGKVKVLDFGLAKALAERGSSVTGTISLPATAGATAPHSVIGTAAYMSPEQAKGRVVDERADVWAFGCVVYECLTGRRAFAGDSLSETLAAVLRDEVDWSRLPADTPPALARLLRRCLERDPERRLRSLGDARLELDDAAAELRSGARVKGGTETAGRRGLVATWLPWLVAAAAVAALSAFAVLGGGEGAAPEASRRTRLTIAVDSLDATFAHSPAISPDGSRVVYSATGHLWLRAMDDLTARPLRDTEGARGVFWSPDSRSIGYQAQKRLWRLSLDGGRPVAVCDTDEDFSDAGAAAWGEDGRIVFATGDGALYAVNATGGAPQVILDMDTTLDDDFHSPSLLPGGRGVLFVPHPLRGRRDHIDLLADGRRRTILTMSGEGSVEYPVYNSGHILFTNEQPDPGIWAVPFDLDRLETTGEPFLVADEASASRVSNDGTLVYVQAHVQNHNLVRVGLDGVIDPQPVAVLRHVDDAAFSPSGDRLLMAPLRGSDYDVEVWDLARGTHVTVAAGLSVFNPFWIDDRTLGLVLPDSARIVASELNRTGEPRVIFSCDGRSSLQRMASSPSVTADRRAVVFTLFRPETQMDVWIAPLDDPDGAKPLIVGARREENPLACPTDDLLAYASDESGQFEIYLCRFSLEDGVATSRWQVSSDGGEHARWSRDGRRLYYESQGRMMEVRIDVTDGMQLGRPRVLFDLEHAFLATVHGYAVTPDDRSFILVREGDPQVARRDIIVVQNWLQPPRGR